MKKILIFLFFFLSFNTNIVFGNTQLLDVCNYSTSWLDNNFILGGNNENNISNTNTKIVCVSNNGYDTGFKITDYVGNNIYLHNYNYCGASGFWTGQETTIIDYFGDYYLFSKWSKTGYVGASLHILRKNGINNFHNLQNCGNSYNGQFTFDDENFYFGNIKIEKSTGNIATSGTIPLGNTIGTNNNYIKFILTNKVIVKSSISNDSIIYKYDDITHSLLNEVINYPGISIFGGFNIFFTLDLDEYYYTTGYNIHRIIDDNIVSKSFSGHLSYTSNDGTNDILHTIPSGAVIDVDFSYNNISSYLAGSGATERIYYMSNGILYFNDDLGVIEGGKIIDDSGVDTGGNDFGGGFLDINYDLNFDGEISIAEALVSPITFFNALFIEAGTLTGKIKLIIQKFMSIGEGYTYNFNIFSINSTHADGEAVYFAEQFNYNEEQENSMYELFLVLKNFLYFLVLLIFILIILVIKR